MNLRRAALLMALLALHPARTAAGQDTQPATSAPSFPVVSFGTITYVQYAVDVQDPNHFNSFDLTRAYIQFNAALSPRISFRLTPDIRRISGGPLDGSLGVRLKFGYVNFAGPTAGSWLRLGLQQTPWLDFEEGINRYRVQSQMFAEREGLIPGSSDLGVGYFSLFANQRVEVHGGIYNGEGYAHVETDRGKSAQGRLTVRPFRGGLQGLRLSAFGDWGANTTTAGHRHAIVMASYENTRAVATIEALRSTRPVNGLATEGNGASGFFEIRRSLTGPAGFVRAERFAESGSSRTRSIVGVAYWLKWDRVRLGFVTSVENARSTLPATPQRDRQILAQTHIQF